MVISLFVELAVPDRKKIRPQILRKSIPKLFPVPVYRGKKVLMKNKHFLFSFMKRICKVLSASSMRALIHLAFLFYSFVSAFANSLYVCVSKCL